jgi:hypothetical protein
VALLFGSPPHPLAWSAGSRVKKTSMSFIWLLQQQKSETRMKETEKGRQREREQIFIVQVTAVREFS